MATIFSHSVWVSVDDRLPPLAQMVLAGAWGTAMVAKLTVDGVWETQLGGRVYPTHWQHLPDPPPLKLEPMGSPVSREEFFDALHELVGIGDSAEWALSGSRYDEDCKVRREPKCSKEWCLKTVELVRALRSHIEGENSPIG